MARSGRVAVLAGALLASACATAKIHEVRVVQGRVTDATGQAVSGTPVILVARTLKLGSDLKYTEVARRELKTVTDADGRYRFEGVPGEVGNHFVLFFYGEGFDGVKYRRPPSLDITRRLEDERDLVLSQVLEFNPQWGEAQRLIQEFGPTSDRGRLVRSHGVPEKREQVRVGNSETETWWYYSLGQSYRFTDGKLSGRFEFEPVKPAAPGS